MALLFEYSLFCSLWKVFIDLFPLMEQFVTSCTVSHYVNFLFINFGRKRDIPRKMAANSELSQCMNHFSLDVYKESIKGKHGDNGFMSASSILVVMAMVHMGARGKTLQQMMNTLKFNNLQGKKPEEHLQDFMKVLNVGSPDYTLSSANRLYPHSEKTILEEYIQTVKKYFGADTKMLNFTSQPDASRLEINKWVEEETRGKIKDLLAPGSITPLTAMVLVNAIYFKGDWAEKFDAASTKKQPFHPQGKPPVMVDMMTKKFKKVNFTFNQNLGAQVLELPYKGEELSMVIVLPKEKDGLPALENKLTVADINDLVSSHNMYPKMVLVSLPKFKLEATYVLNDVLVSLGMPDLFDQHKADLSAMATEPLFVSLVIQKAFVDVNEEGTEAAAATAAVITFLSAPRLEKFTADHPFLFMIVHKKLGVPLFMGRLTSPPNLQNVSQQHEEL